MLRSRRLVFAGFSAMALLSGSALRGAETPISWMRTNTELFVDDSRITQVSGLKRVIHSATRLDAPVLEPSEPWEDGARIYACEVHRDPQTQEFLLWYGTHGALLLAKSKDGLHWTKPGLGLVQEGGRDTNILIKGGIGGASILWDEGEVDPRRRFKMLCVVPGAARIRREGGYLGYSSPDGLHWTPYPSQPAVPYGTELVHFIRDPQTRRYFVYVRPYWIKGTPTRAEEKRLGAVTSSADFTYWTPMELTLVPDSIDDAWVKKPEQYTDFYAMDGFPYGHSYLGIIPVLRIERKVPKAEMTAEQSSDDGFMHAQLITSRDGLHWRRSDPRDPVIASGPNFDRSIFNTETAPMVIGDEVWLYYTGINGSHGSPLPPKRIVIGLAKWRLDGFASLDAGPTAGTVETTQMSAPGGTLEINAEASHGSVVVEVVDAAGRALPGYALGDAVPLNGDGVRQKVRWKTHDTLPASGSIGLRFQVQAASLYSYTIEPSK